MASVAPPSVGAFRIGGGRRRNRQHGGTGVVGAVPDDTTRHWAPKWRKLMTSAAAGGRGPPGSFDEFDRTVRGMLNRISAENAGRLLPLDLSLRSPSDEDGIGDSPPWWAARFAALMLTSYLQVMHTNRCARGLAMRSADNVLPAYLDAVGPLLERSPRLVDSISAWFARLLRLHEWCWPTVRLLFLAAKENRDRATLPAHALGRLPAELLKGRILRFLSPPGFTPDAADIVMQGPPAGLCECWHSEDGRRDAAAVLAHILLFAPAATWPRLSAFAFCVIDTALCAVVAGDSGCDGDGIRRDSHVFLAASVLVAVAQRCETAYCPVSAAAMYDISRKAAGGPPGQFMPPCRQQQQLQRLRLDQAPLERMADRLEGVLFEPGERQVGDTELTGFVRSRAQDAIERARRVIRAARGC